MFKKLLLVTLAIFTSAALASAQAEQVIREQISTLMPGVEVESVQETPIPGLYQVASGTNVIYMTEDGKYIIQGELYSVQGENLNNLTDEQRKVAVKKELDAIDPSTFIVYPAENEKTYITVVTDVDCTYCRAFHKEVPELNKAGITVRYMAFPRTAKGSPSYVKMVSVWCNPNRTWALSDAKKGNTPTPLNCDNPVDMHMEVVRRLGFNATPMIILKNGRVIPGYVPAKQLIEAVNEYRS